MNTFGSLAVAGMLVMGGAGMAVAAGAQDVALGAGGSYDKTDAVNHLMGGGLYKDNKLTPDTAVASDITLSVTLSNNSDEPLQGYGVYFYVDGERIEDSFTTVDLEANGTTTIEYDWITDAGYGTHTFRVEAADGGNMVEITGLGETHTFYIGDNDYTWVIVLLVVVIILLVLVMVWVYRKPVKNYGKPKSRR